MQVADADVPQEESFSHQLYQYFPGKETDIKLLFHSAVETVKKAELFLGFLDWSGQRHKIKLSIFFARDEKKYIKTHLINLWEVQQTFPSENNRTNLPNTNLFLCKRQSCYLKFPYPSVEPVFTDYALDHLIWNLDEQPYH